VVTDAVSPGFPEVPGCSADTHRRGESLDGELLGVTDNMMFIPHEFPVSGSGLRPNSGEEGGDFLQVVFDRRCASDRATAGMDETARSNDAPATVVHLGAAVVCAQGAIICIMVGL